MTLSKDEFKVLAMLYAANIDGNIQSEEVEVMLQKSGFDTVEKVNKMFGKMNDVEVLDVRIYASNGQIVVEGAEGNSVMLFDINGRRLEAIRQTYDHVVRFDVPVSGTYLVKISNYPARKIVVIR